MASLYGNSSSMYGGGGFGNGNKEGGSRFIDGANAGGGDDDLYEGFNYR